MAELLPQCQNLKKQVDSLKQFLHQASSLASCDVTPTQTSLRKAISPKFEIVYAAAFNGENNLKQAFGYALEASNSAVFKRIEYYCNHRLLEYVNVLIDTPGIDAPVEKDAWLTYAKIHHPDTSAVVCVLKPSVADIHKRATLSHPRKSTAPLLAILLEALYYLANQLEDILVDSSEEIVTNFFQRLNDTIRKAKYYKQLYASLGNDRCLEQQLQKQISLALKNAARAEYDKFVRESPVFYHERTFSIYQFRQTLQQTSPTFNCQSMVEAEAVIKQLLKLDFELKLYVIIRIIFSQTINQTY